MKTTNKSTVELIDHMGSDLTVVNAARVSFDKESGNYTEEQNTKLINYLAKHNHWSPFAHTSIQLRVSAPIFVARHLVKHQVGLVWNEVSRRYVDDEPVFYFPDKWRMRAENVKQGSSEEEFTFGDNSAYEYIPWNEDLAWDVSILLGWYNSMIEAGCAPEQARMILPQNMMTSWYWTGSLMAFHRVYTQRTDSHAQKEAQEVAEQIGDICNKLFPISWKALTTK